MLYFNERKKILIIIMNAFGTTEEKEWSKSVCGRTHAHAIKLIENFHASKSHPNNKHWIDYVNQMQRSFRMTSFFFLKLLLQQEKNLHFFCFCICFLAARQSKTNFIFVQVLFVKYCLRDHIWIRSKQSIEVCA